MPVAKWPETAHAATLNVVFTFPIIPCDEAPTMASFTVLMTVPADAAPGCAVLGCAAR
jgi:hypothetical protein